MREIRMLRRTVESWQSWGHDAIAWVQSMAHPVLDGFFHAFTFLGDELAYLVLLPLFYWCIHDRLGRRLGLLVFASISVNFSAKLFFGIPRPSESKVRVLVEPGSPSFPSGHAQGTLVMWGYLWHWFRDKLAGWEIPILIFLIGFSRIYLGAHFPQDIVGGWVIGGGLLLLFLLLEPRTTPWVTRRNLGVQMFLVVLLVVLYLGLHLLPIRGLFPYNTSWSGVRGLCSSLGAFLGFGVGVALERRLVRFSSDGPVKQRIMRFAVGMVVVGVVYIGLKLVMPTGNPLYRIGRYALVGLAAAWWAPYLFVKMKLAPVVELEAG